MVANLIKSIINLALDILLLIYLVQKYFVITDSKGFWMHVLWFIVYGIILLVFDNVVNNILCRTYD